MKYIVTMALVGLTGFIAGVFTPMEKLDTQGHLFALKSRLFAFNSPAVPAADHTSLGKAGERLVKFAGQLETHGFTPDGKIMAGEHLSRAVQSFSGVLKAQASSGLVQFLTPAAQEYFNSVIKLVEAENREINRALADLSTDDPEYNLLNCILETNLASIETVKIVFVLETSLDLIVDVRAMQNPIDYHKGRAKQHSALGRINASKAFIEISALQNGSERDKEQYALASLIIKSYKLSFEIEDELAEAFSTYPAILERAIGKSVV